MDHTKKLVPPTNSGRTASPVVGVHTTLAGLTSKKPSSSSKLANVDASDAPLNVRAGSSQVAPKEHRSTATPILQSINTHNPQGVSSNKPHIVALTPSTPNSTEETGTQNLLLVPQGAPKRVTVTYTRKRLVEATEAIAEREPKRQQVQGPGVSDNTSKHPKHAIQTRKQPVLSSPPLAQRAMGNDGDEEQQESEESEGSSELEDPPLTDVDEHDDAGVGGKPAGKMAQPSDKGDSLDLTLRTDDMFSPEHEIWQLNLASELDIAALASNVNSQRDMAPELGSSRKRTPPQHTAPRKPVAKEQQATVKKRNNAKKKKRGDKEPIADEEDNGQNGSEDANSGDDGPKKRRRRKNKGKGKAADVKAANGSDDGQGSEAEQLNECTSSTLF